MGELPLRGLFLLFGAFALLSAGLKGRSSRRAGGGVSVLTLVEGLAGVVLMVTTMTGLPVRVTGSIGMGTAVLVLLSTMTHLGQVRALSRAREESASQRLYTSIKYGSDDGPEGESAAAPPESPAESGGGPAESEESPAESGEEDPITAALRSGHFDEKAFLRSTSGEQGTQGDGDAAPEGEAPVGEAPVGEDLPEGEEEL